MKIVFSEAKSDYKNYVFPYAIWGFPEKNEKASALFAKGFLPASRDLDRFYMCRQIRVRLEAFSPSSENRRILRKCKGITVRLLERDQFEYNRVQREFCKNYADIKFGKDVMTFERLDSIMNSKLISHLLIFEESETGQEVGLVTLYVEESELVYYYYAFYDLNYYRQNLGMYMMTASVQKFAAAGHRFIYLGTCYSKNALYKTQFPGAQFFNGFRWSDHLAELKYIIKRDHGEPREHLVECIDFRDRFYGSSLSDIVAASDFRFPPGPDSP